MRIIVVEDEPNTREGLIGIIKRYTEHEIIYTAVNGKDGLENIRALKPDLVITDIKMPVMDGLTMLQTLHDEGEEFQSLLLTGYSEFEYARKALKLSVTEYILKPLDIEDFLKLLKKVDNKIEKTKIERVSPSQLFWSYLTGTEEEKQKILPVIEESIQVNKKVQISLFLVKGSSVVRESTTEMMEETNSVLDSMCMENYFVVFLSQDVGFLVIVLDTERNRSLKRMFQMRVLEKIGKISECFCSYTTIYGVAGLDERVLHLKDLMRHAFSFPSGTILDDELLAEFQYENMEYPDSLERAVCREVRSGKAERIQELGEQFKKEVIQSKGHPDCIREFTVRFTAGLLRVVNELKENLEKENGIQYIVGNMAKSNSREQLEHQFDKVMKTLTLSEDDISGLTENGMILNVISFIRENYARDITLTETAVMCGVTPEYLSKIFYREMNINFVSFLQNFRISMAKRMLSLGKCKIGEVSEAVGFHDQKYFVKVFKKICGVTPSDYKKEMNSQ